MPLSSAERQDRFHAAFLGLAIGDALGFPLRGVPPASLARLPNLAEDFAPRPRGKFAKGQFSDDTQLMLATAESVIREGKVDGRSTAAHLAWLWQEGIILQPPKPLSEALQKLSHQNIVELDNEKKAAMVSNLLVVLCSDRGTQPIVSAGKSA